MFEEENQMGLFELDPPAPQPVVAQPPPPPAASAKPAASAANGKAAPAPQAAAPPRKTAPAKSSAKPAPAKAKAKAPVRAAAPEPKKVSGLVPEGDVRLTANIRQDLHLKLKIASAHRRTTIGEIIEELIEDYL